MVGIYINDKHDFKEAITDLVALGYDVKTIHTLTGISEKKLISWFNDLGVPLDFTVKDMNIESSIAAAVSEKESFSKSLIVSESKETSSNCKSAPLVLKRKYNEAFKREIKVDKTFIGELNRSFNEINRTPLGSKEWLMNLIIEESTDEEKSDLEQENINVINHDKNNLSSNNYQSFILMKKEQNKRLEELKQKIKEREFVIRSKVQTKPEIGTTSNVDKMNMILKTKKEILTKKIQINKISQSLQDTLNEIEKNEEKILMSRQQIKQIRKYIKQFKSQVNESKNASLELQNRKRILEVELKSLENELQSNKISFKTEELLGKDDDIQKLPNKLDLKDERHPEESQNIDLKAGSNNQGDQNKLLELEINENRKEIECFQKEVENNVERVKINDNEVETGTSTERLTRFITNKGNESFMKNKITDHKNNDAFPLINTLSHKLVSVKDIDYSKPFCAAETSGGICNDPSCDFQHFKIVEVTTDMIAEEINKRLQCLTKTDREVREEELRIFLETNVQKINNNYSLLRLIYDFFSN